MIEHEDDTYHDFDVMVQHLELELEHIQGKLGESVYTLNTDNMGLDG